MILKELAAALDLVATGDLAHEITALASIENATESDVAFVVGAKYAESLRSSKAGVVIIPESLVSHAPGNYILSDDPYASYAKASWILEPEVSVAAGVHNTAEVHPSAFIAPTASVGPGVVVEANAQIEDGAILGAHCVVGRDSIVGKSSRLFARVTLYDNVRLGNACRIQSGAVIGSEGFGYAWTNAGWSQIQQTGGVRIGERVHIGANTTIDCGAIDDTVIEDGVILDNQIQIAHNVRIGKNTAIAGCVGIAGSTKIGSHCQIGGACNIVGHLTIVDRVIINAASLVSRSILQPGRYGSGTPLQPERLWRRSFVNLGKLDDVFKRLRKLERSNKTD